MWLVCLHCCCVVYQAVCEWHTGERERELEEKSRKNWGRISNALDSWKRARKAAKQNCTLMWMLLENTRTQTTVDLTATAVIIPLPFFIRHSFSLSFTLSLFPCLLVAISFPHLKRRIKENSKEKQADLRIFFKREPSLFNCLPRCEWLMQLVQLHVPAHASEAPVHSSNQTWDGTRWCSVQHRPTPG